MNITRLRLSELVEDLAVYPRSCVYDGHVSELRQAIQAGSHLPPPVVDAATKRIVDGFHRKRAWAAEIGPTGEIDVELREYASDADLFLDAVRMNAHHGRRMSSFDTARVATIALKFQIDPEMVATALSLTVERVSQITASKCAVTVASPQRAAATVPIRRGMSHFAGRTLTKRQESAAKVIGGQTALYHTNQLIELCEADALPDDERLMERLAYLRTLLLGKVSKGMAARTG